MQESYQNSRDEKMIGKLDENVKYDHPIGQLLKRKVD